MAVSVRMDPLLEKELEQAAKRQGMTKSQFIVEAVERALGRRDPLQLLHQVKEEFAPYRATRQAADSQGESPASALREKLRAEHKAQQADYAAFLEARAQKEQSSP